MAVFGDLLVSNSSANWRNEWLDARKRPGLWDHFQWQLHRYGLAPRSAHHSALVQYRRWIRESCQSAKNNSASPDLPVEVQLPARSRYQQRRSLLDQAYRDS